MQIDHINIRCADLEVTRAFLESAVGLRVGPRPPFGFPGYWLVNDDGQPLVHLIGTHRSGLAAGVIDHVAFRCPDLRAQIARLKALGLNCTPTRVPDTDIHQCFVKGPDGLHLEFQGPLPA